MSLDYVKYLLLKQSSFLSVLLSVGVFITLAIGSNEVLGFDLAHTFLPLFLIMALAVYAGSDRGIWILTLLGSFYTLFVSFLMAQDVSRPSPHSV